MFIFHHFLLFCGLSVVFSAPLCPCPEGKWQPPFRPSQVLYSEFPEDRGRSLNIERNDRKYPYSSYDPPPGGNSLSSGPKDDYHDYDSSSSKESPPSDSIETSGEYYKHYNGYNGYNDYDRSKETEENEADFTLEDFEIDPVVMNPPPAESSENSGSNEYNYGSTDVPKTQLELPATKTSPARPPPIQVNEYAFNRKPIPVFRNPALNLMGPHKPGWNHWKRVLDFAELSNLQVMKPPPLGQAQTWARISQKLRSRTPVLYV